MKRYFGRFAVEVELLESMYDLLLHDLFSKIIILRAEHLYAYGVIEYIGYSKELFKEIPEGIEIPSYRATFENGILEMKQYE